MSTGCASAAHCHARALRDAGGVDVILSTTNSARQIASAFTGLRPGGRLVNMGVPDGPIAIDPGETARLTRLADALEDGRARRGKRLAFKDQVIARRADDDSAD
jgi:threonine dehydrogenase-like Zn-dependent dehydrogenase